MTWIVRLEEDRLQVSGEVTPDTVVAIRRQGEALLGGAGSELTIDLSGVASAHSVVLSLLLCWLRFARQRGQSLAFTGISERLHSLAALSGLEGYLGNSRPG